jgi:hypothetical protein
MASKEKLLAKGFEAIGLCREAVQWVDEKRKQPSESNFSPIWYEKMKKFLENNS